MKEELIKLGFKAGGMDNDWHRLKVGKDLFIEIAYNEVRIVKDKNYNDISTIILFPYNLEKLKQLINLLK